jgi:internalin A
MERQRNGRWVGHYAAWLLVATACGATTSSPHPSTSNNAQVPAADEPTPAWAGPETPERRDCTGPLTFDDEMLEAAVRKAISKPDGAILPADVQQLSSVNVSQSAVAKLGGLQCLRGLRSLYLDYTQVSDLSPLAALPNLEVLELDRTQVSDLKPLAGSQLVKLGLFGTPVADLSPLAGLRRLRLLDLRFTPIDDLKPLLGLDNLKLLCLDDEAIKKHAAAVEALRGRGVVVDRSCS